MTGTAVTLKHIYFTMWRHWLNAHGISNTVDILSQNYYRHAAIHLSCWFKNVSQLIVNGRKSSWANISISWSWFFAGIHSLGGRKPPLLRSLIILLYLVDRPPNENSPFHIYTQDSRLLKEHAPTRIKLFFASLFRILTTLSANLTF